jgi:hypothetical protein
MVRIELNSHDENGTNIITLAIQKQHLPPSLPAFLFERRMQTVVLFDLLWTCDEGDRGNSAGGVRTLSSKTSQILSWLVASHQFFVVAYHE